MSELTGLAWHRVSSSNVSSIAWDSENKILYVEFHHGGTYAYDDVKGSLFRNFLNASSPGRYFQKHIRDNHSTRKVK